MRVAITGEKGFIATNLASSFKNSGHIFVGLTEDDELKKKLSDTHEPCVYSNDINAWESVLQNHNIDVLVHNAAVVGTDVVALNSNFSSLTNIAGTYNIARAAKNAGIPVCYLGTTVIYDTQKYQDSVITEASDLNPKTFYGIQKLSGEQIIRHNCDEWMIIRPLFAYGGLGDMNSLIAKSIYSSLKNVNLLDMFLDPTKVKDYMHVTDFCSAVVLACEKGLWKEDYNIAAETPFNTQEIVKLVSEIMGRDIDSIIRWHPKTDYLGNHVLSSRKFKMHTDWHPKVSLLKGAQLSLETILQNDGSYDPLKYLNEAQSRGIDLTKYY